MSDNSNAKESATAGTSTPPPTPKKLIVFVRGLHRIFPGEARYKDIEETLKKCISNSEVCQLPSSYLNTYWSGQDPTKLAASLEKQIATKVTQDGFTELYLVGHSYGALLLRKAILLNLGGTRTSVWHDKVKRIILLGGANRGFLPYNLWTEFLASIARLIQWLPTPLCIGQLALNGLRGSAWLNDLRMTWLEQHGSVPFTVQIRGSNDSLIGPHDSIDLARSTKFQEFVISDVGHLDLALLRKSNISNVSAALNQKIADAVTATPRADNSTAQDAHHVVFLLHGIRDYAEWHEDLGETIKQNGDAATEVVPISYGYFSALQFLSPTARNRCSRTFLDRYVQTYARNPSTTFSVVAHSNGTFALTHALRNNSFVRLRDVFLAGSVLYRKFDWTSLRSRVTRVRNECSSRDWPVGVICGILRIIYWRKLGTSGVYGFLGDSVHPNTSSFVRNTFRKGGHSAALNPKYHEEISRFVLGQGEMNAEDEPNVLGKLGRFAGFNTLRVIVGLLLPATFLYLACYVATMSIAPIFKVLMSAAITTLYLLILLLI